VPRIRAATLADHKVQTRREILDSGLRLFSKLGFGGTKLTDVAATAGLGRTTLYEYYQNKVELFLGLVEDRVPPLPATMLSALPADVPPLTRLEAMVRGCFELVVTEQDLARLVFVAGRELPLQARLRLWRTLSTAYDELMRISHHIAEGADATLVARALADLIGGGIEQALIGRDLPAAAARIPEIRLRFLASLQT